MNMLERFLDNITTLNAIINIVSKMGSIIIWSFVAIFAFFKIKLNFAQEDYLKLPLDKQTKKSMKYYIPTRGQNIDPCDDENSISSLSIELIPYFIKKVFKETETQYFSRFWNGKNNFFIKTFF